MIGNAAITIYSHIVGEMREIQIRCNWSESIIESITERVREQERINARIEARIDVIVKMIKANATKEQIISYGFTEDEYAEAEDSVYAYS